MAHLDFNIWAIIILSGAAQGLFLSCYLLTKTTNRAANKWLAFLLMAVSLHLTEYAADISGITLRYPYWIAVTYPLLFCMGPLYFLYCQALLNKDFRLGYKTALHFLPALSVIFMMLPFYLTTPDEKVHFIESMSDGNSLKIPAGQLVFMALHLAQTIAYVFIVYRFIREKKATLKHLSSDTLLIRKMGWLNVFNLSFSVYLLFYLVLIFILWGINAYQIQIDYVMLLITSFSMYAIGYAALGNPEVFQAGAGFHSSEGEIVAGPPRNGHKHGEIKEKLLAYMEARQPYLTCDLKISELADSLSVPYYQLSQVINDEFAVSFYDFINQYRVEEAKKRLADDDRNVTILAIAYETGFNSKATFNRVFKKFTHLTPSEFREEMLSANKSATPARL